MSYRKTIFAQGELYHVFNRSVAKLPLFSISADYRRFLDLTDYYHYFNTPMSFSLLRKIGVDVRRQILKELHDKNPLHVEILAFCLMNNHYHFLLKQLTSNGITKFISNVQNSYAKYFNIRTERTGPLFQPMFRGERIESDEQLLHVSRYIHLNPTTGYLVKTENLESYPWSSLSCYLGDESCSKSYVSTSMILGIISKEKYKDFVYDQVGYQRELAKIKHLILE